MFIYFTFVFKYSAEKITKAFIANVNLVSLLITCTGRYKTDEERLIGHKGKCFLHSFGLHKLFLVKKGKGSQAAHLYQCETLC